MINNPLVNEILMFFLRWLATVIGGYLLTKGLLTENQQAAFIQWITDPHVVAGVVALLGGLFAGIRKVQRNREARLAALAMDKGSTERQLIAVLKDPNIQTAPATKSDLDNPNYLKVVDSTATNKKE